jgi:YD repeat-containing protein
VAVRTVNVQGCYDIYPNFPYAPVAFDFLRGELKFEGTYKENGQAVKEVGYTPQFTENAEKTPCFIASYYAVGQSTWTLGTYYELATARKAQTQVVETLYGAGGTPMTSTNTVFYESSFHHDATRRTITNSKGETVESKYKYAFDFRLSTCDGIANGYPQYTASCATCQTNYNNQRSQCVYDPSNPNAQSNCYTSAYLTYQQCLATARKNYVDYRWENFNKPNNNFQAAHNTAKSSADVTLKPVLELQDRYQNPLIEATAWKAGKLMDANFTTYDFTAADVYPVKSEVIPLTSMSASFTPSSNTSSSLSKDSRYVQESSALFSGGTLSQIKDRSGVYTSYLWSASKTMAIVKAVGVDYSTLQAAYNAVNGNLTQLRSQPSLNSAFLTTYVYRPLIGLLSETDVNGRTTTYSYDPFGRLSFVRDKDNNVIKRFCYNYAGQAENCSLNLSPNWQATGATQCVVSSGQNTGYQQRQEKDVNPYSSSYNQLRWVDNGYNPTACPLPSTCSYSTCEVNGPQYHCVNGQCEYGYLVYTSSYYDYSTGQYACYYHYEWSDGMWSQDYVEYSNSACFL